MKAKNLRTFRKKRLFMGSDTAGKEEGKISLMITPPLKQKKSRKKSMETILTLSPGPKRLMFHQVASK